MSNVQIAPNYNSRQFLTQLSEGSKSDVVGLRQGDQGEFVVRSKSQSGVSWSKSKGFSSQQAERQNRATAKQLVHTLLSDPSINKRGVTVDSPKAEQLIRTIGNKPVTVKVAQLLADNLRGIQNNSAKGVWKALGTNTTNPLLKVARFTKAVLGGNLGRDEDGSKANEIHRISKGQSKTEYAVAQKKLKGVGEENNNNNNNDVQAPPQEMELEEIVMDQEPPTPKGENEFLKELQKKVEPRRQRIDQGLSGSPGFDGAKQSSPTITQGEKEKLMKVLDEVLLEEGGDDVSASDTELNETQINQLMSVLKEIAPDGIEPEEDHETVDQSSLGLQQTGEQEESHIDTIKPDGINDDVQEDLSHTYSVEDELAKPPEHYDDLNYVDLRDPSQVRSDSTGPSRDEISDFAAILSGRPRKKDVQELLHKLTN